MFNETVQINICIVLLVYIYLVFAFFLLMNNFDTQYIRSLSDLKKFGTIFPLNLLFLVTILSFAGIPPLFGFTIKLITFFLVFDSGIAWYITLLTLFNFFTLYFYIQNVRFLINTSRNNYYIYFDSFVVLSDTNMFISIVFFIVNTIGIVYLAEVLIIFNLVTAQ